jgi:putative YphP/YqiW family bacilliredoxin
MRTELVDMGVQELRTADEVDTWFGEKSGTALVLVNSVCGCAAGAARPGLQMALDHAFKPDRVATVFAGQDTEATARARELFGDVPPSSPSLALLKDGALVQFVPRHMIEGHAPEGVAAQLQAGFDKFCVGE